MKEGVFVAVQDATVVTNTRKIDKYKAVKSTDAATGNGIVAVQDKTTSEKLFNKNVVDAKSVNVPKKRIKGAHHMVYGPTTNYIFDAELLEEGVKRNRPLKNRSFIIYDVANIFSLLLRSYNSTTN